jgi:hypothetical protein
VQTRASRPAVERLLGVVAFCAVHGVLLWLAATAANEPIGDVTITYSRWVATGLASNDWVGLDSAWVYPILALVPMVMAAAAGVGLIGTTWLLLMTAFHVVVALVLWRFRALGVRVLWWWLLFLLALGPIALGRIDTVATAIALVGVAFVTARPAIASALFTVAAWVKVWPAALVLVLVALRRGSRRGIVVGALVVSVAVVVIDLVLGGGAFLISFIGQQAGRALQIESPLATPFLWQATAHVPGAAVYYDQKILTFEVSGPGTGFAARLSTPLMALVVVAGVVLAIRAVMDGVRRSEVAPLLATILVGALIVTNKVGSPQYIGWLAVPIVWGLIAGTPSARRFRVAAVLAVPLAALTQVIYPGYYDQLLTLHPWILVVLSVRNALEVAFLLWAVVALVRCGTAARRWRAAGSVFGAHGAVLGAAAAAGSGAAGSGLEARHASGTESSGAETAASGDGTMDA